MPRPPQKLAPGLLAICLAGGVVGCDAPRPAPVHIAPAVDGTKEAQEEVVPAIPAPPKPVAQPTPQAPPAEELVAGYLVIAGTHVPVSTKVVPWEDEEGFNGNTPGPEGPRFGERKITDPALADEVKANGWNHERLARQVDQFVLHFDGCCTSRQCAGVLEERGLSVHFLLDADGTVYQALDLSARAWHATIANDRSIGIEIANPGAAAEAKAPEFLARFYMLTADGWPMLCPPAGPDRAWPIEFAPRPARPSLIHGPIHQEKLAQYDYTPQQYEALARLLAALHREFPKIKLEVPREADGTPMARQLTEEEFAKFQGVLGHYHVQRNKIDPGPAMQWEWLLKRAKEVEDASAKDAPAQAPTPAQAAPQ